LCWPGPGLRDRERRDAFAGGALGSLGVGKAGLGAIVSGNGGIPLLLADDVLFDEGL